MKRVVGSLEWRGFGSPIRWATPVVCTEHGPLKCTLTFIRISLTPIMGEPARLEEESTVSSDLSHPQNLLDGVMRVKSLLSKQWKLIKRAMCWLCIYSSVYCYCYSTGTTLIRTQTYKESGGLCINMDRRIIFFPNLWDNLQLDFWQPCTLMHRVLSETKKHLKIVHAFAYTVRRQL